MSRVFTCSKKANFSPHYGEARELLLPLSGHLYTYLPCIGVMAGIHDESDNHIELPLTAGNLLSSFHARALWVTDLHSWLSMFNSIRPSKKQRPLTCLDMKSACPGTLTWFFLTHRVKSLQDDSSAQRALFS